MCRNEERPSHPWVVRSNILLACFVILMVILALASNQTDMLDDLLNQGCFACVTVLSAMIQREGK